MGKLLYLLTFAACSNNEDFEKLKISLFDNVRYKCNFSKIQYDLDLKIKLNDKNNHLVPITITKDITISKSPAEPMILRCIFAIDTKNEVELKPLADDDFIKSSYVTGNDINEYFFQDGYKLQVGRDIFKSLKVYMESINQKLIPYKLSHVALIDEKIIDSDLTWWFC